jgi:hypothetical protein
MHFKQSLYGHFLNLFSPFFSEPEDFGYYGCAVSNRLGKQEVAILLDKLGKTLLPVKGPD